MKKMHVQTTLNILDLSEIRIIFLWFRNIGCGCRTKAFGATYWRQKVHPKTSVNNLRKVSVIIVIVMCDYFCACSYQDCIGQLSAFNVSLMAVGVVRAVTVQPLLLTVDAAILSFK